MTDPLLFVIGMFVTAIVGIAVWSIGAMEIEKGAPAPVNQDDRERARH